MYPINFMSLINLTVKWENIAWRKWYDAKHEEDPMGKKLIENGALCYQNCAHELKESLIFVLPQSLTTPEGVQK